MSERSLGSLFTDFSNEQFKLITGDYAGTAQNKRHSNPGKKS